MQLPEWTHENQPKMMETYECQKTWEKTFSTEWPSHSAWLENQCLAEEKQISTQHSLQNVPSKPRGTSTNQHEQAWTMKLVSISHVFSITWIACCNVLWHNLIFYKLNELSVTMYLQNDSTTLQRNVTTKWLTTRKVMMKNTFRRLSNKHSSWANCRIKWRQNASTKINPCWRQKYML